MDCDRCDGNGQDDGLLFQLDPLDPMNSQLTKTVPISQPKQKHTQRGSGSCKFDPFRVYVREVNYTTTNTNKSLVIVRVPRSIQEKRLSICIVDQEDLGTQTHNNWAGIIKLKSIVCNGRASLCQSIGQKLALRSLSFRLWNVRHPL